MKSINMSLRITPPGFVYNDGSLDIYIQHKKPIGHEFNWLPVPEVDFNLLLRMYKPPYGA